MSIVVSMLYSTAVEITDNVLPVVSITWREKKKIKTGIKLERGKMSENKNEGEFLFHSVVKVRTRISLSTHVAIYLYHHY